MQGSSDASRRLRRRKRILRECRVPGSIGLAGFAPAVPLGHSSRAETAEIAGFTTVVRLLAREGLPGKLSGLPGEAEAVFSPRAVFAYGFCCNSVRAFSQAIARSGWLPEVGLPQFQQRTGKIESGAVRAKKHLLPG